MTAEYVEGTTLAERCREGPLPSRDAIREICDVLSGLEEAHELGIVHRGITADHVMLTSEGDVHKLRRRLIQPVFHHQRIESYGKVMAEYADRASKRRSRSCELSGTQRC